MCCSMEDGRRRLSGVLSNGSLKFLDNYSHMIRNYAPTIVLLEQLHYQNTVLDEAAYLNKHYCLLHT